MSLDSESIKKINDYKAMLNKKNNKIKNEYIELNSSPEEKFYEIVDSSLNGEASLIDLEELRKIENSTKHKSSIIKPLNTEKVTQNIKNLDDYSEFHRLLLEED